MSLQFVLIKHILTKICSELKPEGLIIKFDVLPFGLNSTESVEFVKY